MTRRLEFSATTKRKAFDRAMANGGLCECRCGAALQPPKVEYDHRIPCALGGDNSIANCMVLTAACHRTKTANEDVPRIRKADRQKVAAINAKPKGAPITSRGFPAKQRVEKIPVIGRTQIQRRYGL